MSNVDRATRPLTCRTGSVFWWFIHRDSWVVENDITEAWIRHLSQRWHQSCMSQPISHDWYHKAHLYLASPPISRSTASLHLSRGILSTMGLMLCRDANWNISRIRARPPTQLPTTLHLTMYWLIAHQICGTREIIGPYWTCPCKMANWTPQTHLRHTAATNIARHFVEPDEDNDGNTRRKNSNTGKRKREQQHRREKAATKQWQSWASSQKQQSTDDVSSEVMTQDSRTHCFWAGMRSKATILMVSVPPPR